MKPLPFFLLALLLLPVIAAAQGAPPELDVQFHEVLRLGDDESKPVEYLFGRPEFVVTDTKGNLYVADLMNLEIRAFSPEGDYLHTIGRRGRGPGEFRHITAMTIDSQDHLIVIDERQHRITRFAPSGEVLDTYVNSDLAIVWAREFLHLPDAPPDYIVLAQVSELEESNIDNFLLHGFDEELSETPYRFGKQESPATDRFSHFYMTQHPGSVFSYPADNIIFAPGLYEGQLYRYSSESERDAGVFTGHVEDDGPSYEILDPDRGDPNTFLRFQFLEEGEMVTVLGRPLRMSAGLFRLSAGEIVHFTYYNHDTHAYLSAEVFSEDGELIGYGRVEEELRATAFPATLRAVWIDDKDRLYLIDRNEAPVVRVVEFDYEVVD